MIRKGDTVMVMVGKSRGKTGKVLSVVSDGERALVEKLNMVKRHTRPNQQMRQGGIIEKEASIHVSNLMLFCDKCKKAVRAKQSQDKQGKRNRACVKCGEKVGV